MKKFILLFVLSAFALVSCEKVLSIFDKEKETTFSISYTSKFNVASVGANIAVKYRITNPIEGVSVVATSSEDWVVESGALKNTLIFTIPANESDVAREATITLLYGNIERVVTVCQMAAGAEDSEFTQFEYLSGLYHGNKTGATECDYNYYIALGTERDCFDISTGEVKCVKGHKYLFLNIFASTPAENLNISFDVPVGNYVWDTTNSTTAGVVGEFSSYLYVEDGKDGKETDFVSGSVTITEESIFVTLLDENGKWHKYRCDATSVDNTNNFHPSPVKDNCSTLNGDLGIAFSKPSIYASCYGDSYMLGKQTWVLYVEDSATGDNLYLNLLANSAEVMPIGTFVVSYDLGNEQMLLPGFLGYEYLGVWSWYHLYDDDRDILGSAPIVDGVMTIEDNGDSTYTMTIDFVDDCGNKITGVCVSAVTF